MIVDNFSSEDLDLENLAQDDGRLNTNQDTTSQGGISIGSIQVIKPKIPGLKLNIGKHLPLRRTGTTQNKDKKVFSYREETDNMSYEDSIQTGFAF